MQTCLLSNHDLVVSYLLERVLKQGERWLSVVRLNKHGLRDVVADFVKLDLLSKVGVVHLDEFLLSHLDRLDESKLMVTADQDLGLLLILDHGNGGVRGC